MSYEEEDTCMSYGEEDTFMSYEEEDTCMSYEEEYTYLPQRTFGCAKRPASFARAPRRRWTGVPAQTKQVSKETYRRGKRDLLYADF
jgi:hypothetical protein